MVGLHFKQTNLNADIKVQSEWKFGTALYHIINARSSLILLQGKNGSSEILLLGIKEMGNTLKKLESKYDFGREKILQLCHELCKLWKTTVSRSRKSE